VTPEEELDHTPLCFGKYAGKTPDQISDRNPGYVVWLYEQCKPQCVSRALYEACREDISDTGPDWDDRPF